MVGSPMHRETLVPQSPLMEVDVPTLPPLSGVPADLRPSSYGPVTSYTRQAFHPYARDARL